MELRHLDALLAIAEEGSFTAAADALATVQSNVRSRCASSRRSSVPSCFVRSRRGAIPTECGEVVLERARRIRRELEALRADLSMLQGLDAGEASFGIVGTASRWVVPGAGRGPAGPRAGGSAARERGGVGTARGRGRLGRARAGGRHRAGRRPAARGRDTARRGVVRRRAGRSRCSRRGRFRSSSWPSSGSCSRRSPTRCAARSRPPPTRRASRSTSTSRSRASG